MSDNNSWGVNFIPGQGDDQGRQGGVGRPGGANPVQSAIQMLSLRLPRLRGAQGLAPGPLLQAPGGGGMPGGGLGGGVADNPLLQALLRLAGLGGGSGGAMAPAGGGMAAPAAPMGMGAPRMPRVIPGYEDKRRGPGVPTFPGADPGFAPLPYGKYPQTGDAAWQGTAVPRPPAPALSPISTDRRNPATGTRADGATSDWWSGPVERRPFNRSL